MTNVLTDANLMRFQVEGGMWNLQFVVVFLLKIYFKGCIGATDGQVGALLFNGEYFVTMPNQNYILQPPLGDRKVIMHADSLYADDDPTLWPQLYNAFNCHHIAIPKHDSLSVHLIMWWEPKHNDFILLKDAASPIRGLGKLSDLKLGELKSSASVLLSRVKTFMGNLSKSRAPALGPVVKMIEHGLLHLGSVSTNFHQMVFGVRDVQWCWLDVMAMMDYMEVYKPQMDSARLTAGPPPAKVADTVGVFTSDVCATQDFFHAGLPFWLTWLASDFGQRRSPHRPTLYSNNW